ncbi:hypothetical protein H7U34_01820 [Collinsella tanakaei]|nr:hypothetical protein [Collinsella tanakaei]
MLDLGTLKINIKTDGAAAKKELDGVKKSTEDVEKENESATKSMGDSWKDFSSKVKTAAVAGFAAITASIAGLVSTAVETESSMSKLDTAFEQAGHSAEAANDTYKSFVGLLGETDTAVEASNHLAKLCDSEEELSQWTNIAAGVYATFGDSLPLEGLTEAANETAKTGTVTGSLADALNWAGVSEDEFNERLASCNTEQERAQMITDTLNGLYDETGQKYRENNEDLIRYKESQDRLNQALSDLGMLFMPVVTGFTDIGASIAEHAEPYIQWLVDNLPTIKNTLGELAPIIMGVVTGFIAFQAATTVAAGIQTLIGVFNGLRTALQNTTVAQALLNAVMNANPIVLIITLIAGLVGALVTLYMTNETARNFINNAWSTIQSVVGGVVGALVGFFTVTVPYALQSMISWFSQLPGQIGSFLSSVISRVASWVGQMASNAANAASRFGSSLINGLQSIPGRVVSIGRNIIQGLVSGITSAAGTVVSAVTGAVGGAINAAKNLLGIHSPSRVFKEIGDFTMQGFEVGIDESLNNVVKTAKSAAKSVTDAFNPQATMPEYGASTAGTVGRALTYVADRGGKIHQALSSAAQTTYNYFIGDTRVDTITQQRFAQEFVALMQKYDRLAVT